MPLCPASASLIQMSRQGCNKSMECYFKLGILFAVHVTDIIFRITQYCKIFSLSILAISKDMIKINISLIMNNDI